MRRVLCVAVAMGLLVACGAARAGAPSPEWATKDLKAGIIGTDTSHVPAFAACFAKHPEWRVKLVAAFPAGSPDLPASWNRVKKYAKTLEEKFGVEIVDSVEALLAKVDVVLIEDVDGRPHLKHARPVFEAKKRLFIDKPFTASLEDAREIVRLSKATGVPFISSSVLRFLPEAVKFRKDAGVGKVQKVETQFRISYEPHHPDLFWYGIHGVETLYTVMGRGCVSVSRRIEGNFDITTGKWADGRIGVFRGVRKGPYKPLAKVWGAGGEVESKGSYSFALQAEAIARFFHTGQAPIDPLETLEIVEFMTAAQLSKERGGAEVKLEELRK